MERCIYNISIEKIYVMEDRTTDTSNVYYKL